MVSNLKQTTTGMRDLEKQEVIKFPAIEFDMKKPGTSVISFYLKTDGKTYSYKCKVTIVNYSNPFKSFKIGKKDYADLFEKEASPS